MRKQILKRIGWGLALTAIVAVVTAVLLPKSQPAAAQAAPPDEGIILG